MMEMLERFVVAVEKIAIAMESRAESIAAAANVLEEHREAMAPSNPDVRSETTPDREEIKKQLDALGIAYAPKTRTENLMQMLVEAQKVNPVPAEPVPAEPVPAEPMSTEEAHKQIREGLKRVAVQHGSDKAREMLRTHAGGAENVSAVQPEFYRPLIDALAEV